MHVYVMCVQYLQRPGKDIRSPVAGVTEGCELQCGCWEPNLGPLEEWLILLMADPMILASLTQFLMMQKIIYVFRTGKRWLSW